MKSRIEQILFFILFFTWSLPGSGQTTLFLKSLKGAPGYTLNNILLNYIDTLNRSSFISTGYCMREKNAPGDTLNNDSFILKNLFTGNTKWIRKYHLQGRSLRFSDVTTLPDKDLLVLGNTDPFEIENPVRTGCLLKVDSNGTTKWFRVYPKHTFTKILSLSNGDVAITMFDSTLFLKVMLLGTNGNQKWIRKFGAVPIFPIYGLDMVEGPGRKILIVAEEYAKPFLLLLDSTGNKINDLRFNTGNLTNIKLEKATRYFDKGYFVTGSTWTSQIDLCGFVLRLDPTLGTLYLKGYNTSANTGEFFDIATLDTNTIAVLCEPEGHGATSKMNPRSGIVFMDTSGVIVKTKLFTPDSSARWPHHFIPIQEGKFLFSQMKWFDETQFGVIDSSTAGFCGYKAITYSTVSIPYSHMYGQTKSIQTTTITGYPESLFVYNPFDLKIVYMCSDGPQGPLDTLTQPPADTLNEVGVTEWLDGKIEILPNPANYKIHVRNGHPRSSLNLTLITVLSSTGENVFVQKVPPGLKSISFDVSEWPNGVYLLTGRGTAETKVVKKFIIQH